MRFSWVLCAAFIAVSCGAETPRVEEDASGDRDVEELPPPEFTATIVFPGAEPTSFVANVLVSCAFEKPGQLRVSGSAVSAEGTENLSLRMGTLDADVPAEGRIFPVTGISGAEDVVDGEAAIAWSGGGVEPAVALDGSITIFSLDPCAGVFEVRFGLAEGSELEVQGGAFWIPRDSE
jgi:hypothetical protein